MNDSVDEEETKKPTVRLSNSELVRKPVQKSPKPQDSSKQEQPVDDDDLGLPQTENYE